MFLAPRKSLASFPYEAFKVCVDHDDDFGRSGDQAMHACMQAVVG